MPLRKRIFAPLSSLISNEKLKIKITKFIFDLVRSKDKFRLNETDNFVLVISFLPISLLPHVTFNMIYPESFKI